MRLARGRLVSAMGMGREGFFGRRRFVELAAEHDRVLNALLSPEQRARLMQISIQSTGIYAFREPDIVQALGLSAEQRAHLFLPFEQADPSTTRKYGGTGLGLAISKRLAELMGGSMWVESAGIGRGATFSFTITAVVE